MKLSKGQFRDASLVTQPTDTYVGAMNMCKDVTNLINESGIEEKFRLELGDDMTFIHIGSLELPVGFVVASMVWSTTPSEEEEIVYYFMLQLYDEVTDTIEVILYTQFYEFTVTSAIKMEHRYNGDGELILILNDRVCPPYILNVSKLPSATYGTDTLGTQYIANKTLFNPHYTLPKFTLLSVTGGGNLKSGIYYIGLAYEIEHQIYTDIANLSNAITVYPVIGNIDFELVVGDETNQPTNRCIKLQINNRDESFAQYKLYVFHKEMTGTTVYDYGDYDTDEIYIKDLSDKFVVDIDEVLNESIRFNTVQDFKVRHNYLYATGITIHEFDNVAIQEKINNITVHATLSNVTHNTVIEGSSTNLITGALDLTNVTKSYKNEVILFNNKSFMPGEVLALYARLVHESGAVSDAFHIMGRMGTSLERSNLLDTSPYYPESPTIDVPKRFQYIDTSSVYSTNTETGEKVFTMGYWENIHEVYPRDMGFGAAEDSRIRHHRLPSLSTLVDNGLYGFADTNQIEKYDVNLLNTLQYQSDGGIEDYNNINFTEDLYLTPSITSSGNTWGKDLFVEVTYTVVIAGTYLISQPMLVDNGFYLDIKENDPYDLQGDIRLIVGHKVGSAATTELLNTIADIPSYNIGSNWLFASLRQVTINGELPVSCGVGDKLSIRYQVTTKDTDWNFWLTTQQRQMVRWYNVPNILFQYTQSSSILPVSSKQLGVQFTYNPSELMADGIVGIQFYAAKRDFNNSIVMSQTLINNNDTIPTSDTQYESYPFDMLSADIVSPSTHIELGYYITQDIAINSVVPIIKTPQFIAANTSTYTGMKFNVTVNSSVNVPRNNEYFIISNGYKNYNNNLSLIQSTAPYVTSEITTNESTPTVTKALVVTIYNIKEDLYGSFYNQELYRIGETPLLNSFITSETLRDINGDTVISLQGITRYYNLGASDPRPRNLDTIRYYLLPIFSIKNIGLRYRNNELTDIHFPMVNMLTNSLSVGTTWHDQEECEDKLPFDILEALGVSSGHIFDIPETYNIASTYSSVQDLKEVVIHGEQPVNLTDLEYSIFRSRSSFLESNIIEWRKFSYLDYIFISSERGKIVALANLPSGLVVKTQYSHFALISNDSIKAGDNTNLSIEATDLFKISPQELYTDDLGYVGCDCIFSSIDTPYGTLSIDRQKGKIVIVSKSKLTELSKQGMFKFCKDNLQYQGGVSTLIDNPYSSSGIISIYDRNNDRILIRKVDMDNTTDIGWTLSFDILNNQFIGFHSYNYKCITGTRNQLFIAGGLTDTPKIFKLNSGDKGIFNSLNGTTVSEAFVDVVFANGGDSDIFLSALYLQTECTLNGVTYPDTTIDEIMVYNNNRWSDVISISDKVRKTGNMFRVNQFNDVLADKNVALVDISKPNIFIGESLSSVTHYYEKERFVDGFVIVRIIMNNSNNKEFIIQSINGLINKITR